MARPADPLTQFLNQTVQKSRKPTGPRFTFEQVCNHCKEKMYCRSQTVSGVKYLYCLNKQCPHYKLHKRRNSMKVKP